jgi:hypothetical protein
MIPIGTELEPRSKDDAPATVCGIEGGRYVLAPLEFGSPFALDFDAITANYVCDGFKVHVDPVDEAAEWAKLSREKFHRGNLEAERRGRKKAVAESPEEIFKRQEREQAEG